MSDHAKTCWSGFVDTTRGTRKRRAMGFLGLWIQRGVPNARGSHTKGALFQARAWTRRTRQVDRNPIERSPRRQVVGSNPASPISQTPRSSNRVELLCYLTNMANRSIPAVSAAAGLALLCLVSPIAGKNAENIGQIKLNMAALTYAKQLVSQGHVVHDRKGAWANDRPSTELENKFIRKHGFRAYAKWHLGIDDRYAENTKRRYKFPYGDFNNVHRCAVLAAQSRAGQHRCYEIGQAAAELRAMIEAAPEARGSGR